MKPSINKSTISILQYNRQDFIDTLLSKIDTLIKSKESSQSITLNLHITINNNGHNKYIKGNNNNIGNNNINSNIQQ